MFFLLKWDSKYSVCTLIKEGMSSLLLAEMTTTRTKPRKNSLSSRAGPREKLRIHSSARSSWMEERASSFLGTKSTGRFTRKRCCITLIQARKDRSLNINRHKSNRSQRGLRRLKVRKMCIISKEDWLTIFMQ